MNNQSIGKIIKWLVGGFLGMALLGAILGGADSSKPTSQVEQQPPTTVHHLTMDEWKMGFAPAWQDYMADWQTMTDAVAVGDEQAASAAFVSLGRDADAITAQAISPDAYLNSVLQEFGSTLLSFSADGIIVVGGMDSTGQALNDWESELKALKAQTQTLLSATEAASA